MNVLPENDSERGAILLADCLLDYFPNACAAVARHSAKSNVKHNGNKPPHWARDKSTDHRNKIMRHLVDAGGFDADGNRHSVAIAWRGLALLEDELIAEGATPGRNAKGSPDSAARKLYDKTSAIAAEQEAKSSLAELAQEAQAWGMYAVADTPAKSPHDDFTIAQDPPDLPHGWLEGVPAESSYLASFGPNGSRLATEDEVAGLREHLAAEQLREYGIGDVEPATLRGIPDSFTDSHGNRITRRVTPPYPRGWLDCVPCVEPRHPMHTEALRDHDERLNGPEDSL